MMCVACRLCTRRMVMGLKQTEAPRSSQRDIYIKYYLLIYSLLNLPLPG